MVQAEYVRDMHNNYLVLKGMEGSATSYGTKMLLNNIIPGILKIELRCIDKIDLFYYDITSKRSIYEIYENKTISYDEMKNLLTNILMTISNGGDYLLSENDFILDPKYLFVDNVTKNTELCHLAGSQENVQEQLSCLMEYLMNKVDYKEEKAVLLIYALYKESKEIDCTFQKLLRELSKNKNQNPVVKKIDIESEVNLSESINPVHTEIDKKLNQFDKNEKNTVILQKSDKKDKSNIQNKNRLIINLNNTQGIKKEIANAKSPQHLIEVDNEKEIQYYDNKTYIMAGAAIAGGFVTVFLALSLNLLQNSFGTGLDFMKLGCLLIIVCCMEAYIMLKIFDKKNRLTRIKTDIECVEPLENNQAGSRLGYKGFSIGKGDYQDINTDSNTANTTKSIPGNNIGNIPRNTIGDTSDYSIGDIQGNNTGDNPGYTSGDNPGYTSGDNPGYTSGDNPGYTSGDNPGYNARNNPVYNNGYNPGEIQHYSLQEDISSTATPGKITAKSHNTLKNYMEPESALDSENFDEKTQLLWQKDDYEEGKTVILSHLTAHTEYYLEPCLEAGTKIQVKNFPFIIGKSKGADHMIADVSVSRRHAQLQREGNNIYLLDLHSTNGTFVNNIRLGINKPFLLKEEDEITFSEIKFIWKKNK